MGEAEGASGWRRGSWVRSRRTSPFFTVQNFPASQSSLPPLAAAMMVSGPLPGPSQLPAFSCAWCLPGRGLKTSLYLPSAWCETRFFLWPLVLAGVSLLFGPRHHSPAGSVQAWGTGTPRSRPASLSPLPTPVRCPVADPEALRRTPRAGLPPTPPVCLRRPLSWPSDTSR